MTPEFQADYAKHYNAAVESGDLPNAWSRDTDAFDKYFQSTDLPLDDQKLMLNRMKMHDQIGKTLIKDTHKHNWVFKPNLAIETPATLSPGS